MDYVAYRTSEARVEVSSLQYEDEDGRIKVFPPSHFAEEEEEQLEETLIERSFEILEETGPFILCAVFDLQT